MLDLNLDRPCLRQYARARARAHVCVYVCVCVCVCVCVMLQVSIVYYTVCIVNFNRCVLPDLNRTVVIHNPPDRGTREMSPPFEIGESSSNKREENIDSRLSDGAITITTQQVSSTHTHTHTRSHARTLARTHTHTHTHTHTRARARAHTHMHIHT